MTVNTVYKALLYKKIGVVTNNIIHRSSSELRIFVICAGMDGWFKSDVMCGSKCMRCYDGS